MEQKQSESTVDKSSPMDKVPKIEPQYTEEYIQKCKLCPLGNPGAQCRLQYCKQPTACERCVEGEEGSECRVRYCDFYKDLQKGYQSKQFNLANPYNNEKVNLNDPDLTPIQVVYE